MRDPNYINTRKKYRVSSEKLWDNENDSKTGGRDHVPNYKKKQLKEL